MSQKVVKIKFDNFIKYSWPKSCLLCLKPGSQKSSLELGGSQALYCHKCYEKVKRFEKWKDGIFVLAFIMGIIGGILYFISAIREHTVNAFSLIIGTGLFMGLAYVILRVMIFPFQLILHSRLAKPGIKLLKKSSVGTIRIKFANSSYAKEFCQANSQYIVEN